MKQKTFCMRKRGCNSLCKSLHQSYKSKKTFPFREQICFHYKVFACMPVMAEKAIAQLFTDRTVLVHGKHRGQADSGHAEDITGASSRWSQIQVNLREIAFPPPHSCQQGTPGNPTSRRGGKTWRKINHSLLLPSRQNKKENMEEELHSICSTSRDLSATCWLLCFRGVCFGMFLPTTRPELPPSFLYFSLPLEIQILLRTGLSVLPLPPSLLHTGMEWNITALYNRCFFFFIIEDVQSKWSVFSWSWVL